MGAVVGHTYVGDKLVSRISQPHSLDIPSNNISRFLPFGKIVVLYCGTHGIGESFDEYIEQIDILYMSSSTILFL